MDIVSTIHFLVYKIGFISIGLFGIGFLIGFHELGHFLFCKLFKIKVPTFSIGMGPKIAQKKIGDTVFALSAIPLGGYVEIAGQESESDRDLNDKSLFSNKPFYQKILVLSGGILFNFIFTVAVFSFLYFKGMPQNMLIYPTNATTKVSHVLPDSPASEAQIQSGDTILSLNGKKLNSSGKSLLQGTKELESQSVSIEIQQKEEIKTIDIKLGKVKTGDLFGSLGVLLETKKLPPFSILGSIANGFETAKNGIIKIYCTFTSLLSKKGLGNLLGPIRLLDVASNSASKGSSSLLFLLAIISLNFVFFNLVPVPIFDGGQIVLCAVEAIIRRPLPEKAREVIAIFCWVLIIGLYAFLSIKDLWHYFG